MRDEMKKVPRLRFRGFSEDWELCKLKEITERVKGNDGRMDLPTLTISASQGWLNQKDRFSGNIAGKEQKNYTLLLKNELSYNHGNSKLAKYGAVFSLKTYEEALVPRVYHSFKSTKNSDPDFLEYIFATKKPDKELGKLVSSGARMDGLLNINYDDFSNIKINIPHVHEQKKISNLLRKIDDIITLHQRKLDQLKELKKAYLQVMFPAKDERVPKLRFADFEGEWEQCKLGNILTERNTQQSKSKEYPLVSFTVEDGVTPKTERYEREQLVRGDKSSKKYKVTELNDIVYNPANLKFGAIARNHYGKAVFSPIYITFIVNDKLACSSYVEVFITRKDFISYSLKYQQGTVYERQSVSPENLLNMKFLLPNTKEQEFIGHFFEKLDCNSNFHKKKITQLKNLKKSYLQNMFI
ncbi:MAG: restriction endonuclease subunit S [Enterococcus faecalis]|uniref:restriction endonuclease subunit S n=2 Tax=Enterococcus faecalis TaxID=1351 RepID=UPI000C12C285|nr:restriction endonuclease subunit S [Enterococcus faecalis]MDU0982838.1 restriction endonuclease subunit S [Enterococcus faecalis]MDU1039601.1 restriction endonuclease subunit S [Enterococcus faecalis]MDU6172943.1 restriction endonuclease subunit S [Enterococcus faecalis]NMP42952.1 restriction endonuclease subunit S [Enterococcus faecalis]NSR06285.1 restriction endonuclease subunit S [Enterococcus faecalis]